MKKEGKVRGKGPEQGARKSGDRGEEEGQETIDEMKRRWNRKHISIYFVAVTWNVFFLGIRMKIMMIKILPFFPV